MRFLQSEYKPIIAAIKSAGFEENDFSFVKKRGTLHINHLAKGVSFHFFRKTETILNAEKKWEKAVSYRYGSKKKEVIPAKDWEEVFKAFTKWLESV